MKVKRLFFSALLIGALPLLVNAQKTLSLQECINLGLERNFSIRLARNTEEISANNVTLGNAGYLPRLSLSAQQSGVVNNVNQNLADGSSNSSRGVHNTSSNAGLNLNQTIFDGFRVQTTYQQLQELGEIGSLQTRITIENMVAGIIAEYYNLIQQERLLSNLQYAVELSKERARIDEERYLLGSGSKLQLLQSQVYLNADSSRLGRQYETVRTSRIRLNELMALDDITEMVFVRDSVIEVNPNLVYDNLLQATLSNNASLLIASKNTVISEYDRKLIASNTYPYLNFSSGYGMTYNTYGNSTINNQRNLSANYGLTLGFNIFDGLNQRREMSNAAIRIENSRLASQQVEQQTRADLLTIYNAYNNNLMLLNLELQNLGVARENLEIALERYKLGALAGLELREVQKSLLDAEERLLSIQYQTKLAEISLLQISGRIMTYL
ncbi:MAG: TolC family protein [Bacteroidales bacterium]|jgi:outer membrane protein TolC|nr:TolC family protein [Bacteroidales bacterium]NLM93399.1 TolC family protein [Bacteroidales bacterium]